jgi:formate hydrogenlyase subunit 3/multisubunit Na+/H+ antiporter MnhD subunit
VSFSELPEAMQKLFLLSGPGLPIALSLACPSRRWQPLLGRLYAWSALPALGLALLAPAGVRGEFPSLLLNLRLGVDATGRVFLFFTAMLWLLSGLFGRNYLAKDRHRGRFFFFYLLAMGGNLGLILAQDMAGFYLFFALMSFSSYGLVIHNGDADALRAGRIYLYLVVLGEVMLFSALVILYALTGSLGLSGVAAAKPNGLLFALIFLGFGIKAGALPLHVWLPLAHPAAPTPASAVLSGAMIKAGLLGWIRFLPLGEAGIPEWGSLCMVAGLLAAFFGVVLGVLQTNPKTILAYSSISQMGLMTVGVGIGLFRPAVWPLAHAAVMTYALHHAFAKGALFLGVGVAGAGQKSGWQRWWLILGLLLPALALGGTPLTTGVVAKTALKSAVAPLPDPWPAYMDILLPLAAVGTTLLMIRFLFIVLRESSSASHTVSGIRLPWTATVVFTALTAWLLPEAQASVNKALSLTSCVKAVWPLLAAGLTAWGMFLLYRRAFVRWTPSVPAGDLIAAGTWLATALEGKGQRYLAPVCRNTLAGLSIRRSSLMESSRNAQVLRGLEKELGRWPAVGTVLLILSVLFCLLLLLSPNGYPQGADRFLGQVHLHGCDVLRCAESCFDLRLHQRLLDPPRRPDRGLNLPLSPRHGRKGAPAVHTTPPAAGPDHGGTALHRKLHSGLHGAGDPTLPETGNGRALGQHTGLYPREEDPPQGTFDDGALVFGRGPLSSEYTSPAPASRRT